MCTDILGGDSSVTDFVVLVFGHMKCHRIPDIRMILLIEVI